MTKIQLPKDEEEKTRPDWEVDEETGVDEKTALERIKDLGFHEEASEKNSPTLDLGEEIQKKEDRKNIQTTGSNQS